MSGWTGPATVVDVTTIPKGTIALRYQGRHRDAISLKDVRPFETFITLLAADGVGHSATSVFAYIRKAIEDFTSEGKPMLLGPITHATKRHGPVHRALQEWATQHLGLDDVNVFRIGRSTATLAGIPNCPMSVLLWWMPSEPDVVHHHESDGSNPINLREVIGPLYGRARFV